MFLHKYLLQDEDLQVQCQQRVDEITVATREIIDQITNGLNYSYHEIIALTDFDAACYGQFFLVLDEVMQDLSGRSTDRYQESYIEQDKSFQDINVRKVISPIAEVQSQLDYYIGLYVTGKIAFCDTW